MGDKIIKKCCKWCVELGINCMGCAIAAGHPQAPKMQEFCEKCIEKGECVIEFKNMNKNRETCWQLGDEDKETYKKQNPEFAKLEEEKEKKAEEKQAEEMTDEEVERLERLIALKKKKLAEKKDENNSN